MTIGRSTWSRVVFAWALGTWLFGIAADVRADAMDEARILFEAGVAASRAERWLEASEYFHRSLSLAEKPSTWFNLAVAEIKQGHRRAGLSALDAFEQSANPKAHAEMLARVPSLHAQAEALPEEKPLAPPVDEAAPQAQEAPQEDPRELSPAALAPTQAATEPSELPDQVDLGPPRKMIGMGVAGLLASGGAFAWWRGRVGAREDCEAQLYRCTNLSTLKAEERALLGIGVSMAAISVGLIAAGATWLAHAKRSRPLATPQAELDLGHRAGQFKLSFRF